MTDKKSTTKKPIFKVLATIIFIGLFINYYRQNPDSLSQLGDLETSTLILGALFTIVNMVSLGVFLKVVIDTLARSISLVESVYTTALSTLANYVLPFRGGAAVRAVYLKTEYGLSYTKFVASLYGNYILVMLINSFVALATLLWLAADSIQVNITLWLIMLSIFSFALSLTTKRLRLDSFAINVLSRINHPITAKLARRIEGVVDGWKLVAHNSQLLTRMIGVVSINFLARFGMFTLLFSALEIDIAVSYMLLFTALTNLTIFISLTPGALGVRETVLLLYSQTLSLDNDEVLAVSLADRAITLSSILIMTAVLWACKKVVATSSSQ